MKHPLFYNAILAVMDPNNMFGPVMGIIGQIAFALAFISLILGGYRWMSHDHAETNLLSWKKMKKTLPSSLNLLLFLLVFQLPLYAWPGGMGELENNEKITTAEKDAEEERARMIAETSNTSGFEPRFTMEAGAPQEVLEQENETSSSSEDHLKSSGSLVGIPIEQLKNKRGDRLGKTLEGNRAINHFDLAEEHSKQQTGTLKDFIPVASVPTTPSLQKELHEKQQRYKELLNKIKKQDASLANTLNNCVQKNKSTSRPIDVEAVLDQWFPPESIWFGFSLQRPENVLKEQCRQGLKLENQMQPLRKESFKNTLRTTFDELRNKGNVHLITDLLVGSVEKEKKDQATRSQELLTTIRNIDFDLAQQIKEVDVDPNLDASALATQINQKIDEQKISEEQKNNLRTQCYQALGEKVMDQLLSVADAYRGAFMTFVDQKPNIESNKEGLNQYLDKFRATEPVGNTIEYLQQNATILRALLDRLSFLPGNHSDFVQLLKENVNYVSEISYLQKWNQEKSVQDPEAYIDQLTHRHHRLPYYRAEILSRSTRLFQTLLQEEAQRTNDLGKIQQLDNGVAHMIKINEEMSSFLSKNKFRLQLIAFDFLAQIELLNETRDPLENNYHCKSVQLRKGQWMADYQSKNVPPDRVVTSWHEEGYDFFPNGRITVQQIYRLTSSLYSQLLNEHLKLTPHKINKEQLSSPGDRMIDQMLFGMYKSNKLTKTNFLENAIESYKWTCEETSSGYCANTNREYIKGCLNREAALLFDSIKAAKQAGANTLVTKYEKAHDLLFKLIDYIEWFGTDGLHNKKNEIIALHEMLKQADQEALAAGIQVPSRD